jgi:hypothetical protein
MAAKFAYVTATIVGLLILIGYAYWRSVRR